MYFFVFVCGSYLCVPVCVCVHVCVCAYLCVLLCEGADPPTVLFRGEERNHLDKTVHPTIGKCLNTIQYKYNYMLYLHVTITYYNYMLQQHITLTCYNYT